MTDRSGLTRRISLVPIFALLAALVCFSMASVALAQNDANDEFGGGDPPAAAPDNNQAANNNNANNTNTGGDDKGEDLNLLSWTIKSLGYTYMGIFLALSVTLVSLFVMNMLAARRETLCPQELVDTFEEKLNEKEFQEAYDMARTDESVLGQVLSAGLAKLSRGYNKAIEGMQEVGEEESMKLEHRLSYMALIGNLSPMIGLFGTVQGMIASFRVIATSTNTPKPS